MDSILITKATISRLNNLAEYISENRPFSIDTWDQKMNLLMDRVVLYESLLEQARMLTKIIKKVSE